MKLLSLSVVVAALVIVAALSSLFRYTIVATNSGYIVFDQVRREAVECQTRPSGGHNKDGSLEIAQSCSPMGTPFK